ncbi:hypothetical protein [Chryseobacterium cheonjiense]|uniref:Uncharacterized protein n=1 Tax=Chryseobacterium cheonjiense TaxID=2728845 RepID=A0A7Y0A3J9_9FLAO|nr:hypothetical protein [Chryseobacterium cheonjiense]NML55910.1 hypothetical protein [Chryseobacterium cheonjiense]
MNIFNRDQFDVAIAEWTNCCADYAKIQSLIPTNYVFTFNSEQVSWLKSQNKYNEFCAEIGVFKGQLVAILCPMDANGQRLVVDQFPYSVLGELDGDLRLVETEQYKVIKNAVLSKDLQRIDYDSDTYFPVSNKPMLDQDVALEAIESWRNDGMTWFYRECSEFKGSRIFKKFFVPSEDLISSKPGLYKIICSFGLKFSEVYQRVLPTLIFISFYQDLQNSGSIDTISNTYDWSQPCPPLCPLNYNI